MPCVIYGGRALIPAPFISVQKEIARSESGDVFRVGYSIVLKGKLTATRGSPDGNGDFWTSSGYPPDTSNPTADSRLALLRNKQGAIAKLFSTDGLLLEIQPWDGSATTKCNPRVKSVEFSEGNSALAWFDTLPYTITLECDTILWGSIPESSKGGYASSVIPQENWFIEQADDKGRTYRLSHTVSAAAKRRFAIDGSIEAEGWAIARDLVLGGALAGAGATNHIGQGTVPANLLTTPRNLSAFGFYNHVIGQNIDEGAGKYSLTETWLLFDPSAGSPDGYGTTIAANEEFSINARRGIEDGRLKVSVEGQIQGLEVRNSSTDAVTRTRYQSALDKWDTLNLFARSQAYTGGILNPVPVNASYTKNPVNGQVNYRFEFDDRATAFPGSLSESVTVTDDNPNDIFASLPVLGRAAGPVLQAIGTVTASRRNISIEIVMPANTQLGFSNPPNTNALVLSLRPSAAQVFLEKDTASFNSWNGRYSRNIVYVYE